MADSEQCPRQAEIRSPAGLFFPNSVFAVAFVLTASGEPLPPLVLFGFDLYLHGEIPKLPPGNLGEREALALKARWLADDLYRMVRSYHIQGPE
jgi:hypothetical protein